MVIRAAVASMDNEYLRRLISVLEKYPQIDLSVYSDVESILQAVGKKRFDVFMFSSDIMAEDLSCINLQADLKLQLYDENDTMREGTSGIKFVKKYQRVSQIYRQMLDYYADIDGRNSILDAANAQIIAFYSPVGGAGKTTLALVSAMKFARQGKRTFYMSLEDIASEDCFLQQDNEKGLSDLMRYLNSDTNFRMKMEGMMKGKTDHLFYINHFLSPNDIYDMTVEDVQDIVQAVKKAGLFDVVVIDMGTELGDKNQALFELADKVVIVEKSDEISARKMNCFYAQHHIMNEYGSKMICVVNFDNGIINQIQKKLPVLGRVGDIQNMDSSNIIAVLANSAKTDFLAAALSD